MSGAAYEAGSVFEIIAELFDGFGIFSEGGGYSPNRKRNVHEARSFEESLFLRAEAIDFQFDESRELVRDGDFEIGERGSLMPSSVTSFADAHKRSLRDHVIENGVGEEGIAAGALINEIIELGGTFLGLKALAEEFTNGLF